MSARTRRTGTVIFLQVFLYTVFPCLMSRRISIFWLHGRDGRLPMDVSLLTPKDRSAPIAEHRKRIVQNLEECHMIAAERM